jgi:hypothetical protein
MTSIVPCATTAAVAAAAMTNATSERETTGIGARIRALCPLRLAKRAPSCLTFRKGRRHQAVCTDREQ